MTKTQALEIIKSGKFFSCKFVKQDGTIRTLVGRSGVRKHLRGGKLGYDNKAMGYHVVWDLQKRGYRMVNLVTIVELNGKAI